MSLPQPPRNAVYMVDDLLWIDVIGDQTGASIHAMGKEVQDLITQLRAAYKPVRIFDDLRRIGEADLEALKGVAILARILDYDRAAMIDQHSALMCGGTNLLLKSIGRSNAKYFSDAEKAKEWLRKS